MSKKCNSCGGTGKRGKARTYQGSSGIPISTTPLACTACDGTGRA